MSTKGRPSAQVKTEGIPIEEQRSIEAGDIDSMEERRTRWRQYKFPAVELLTEPPTVEETESREELLDKAKELERALATFKVEGKDYHTSADLTGQANHLGVTIEADIVKQKLPTLNGGYIALNRDKVKFGKFDDKAYSELCSDHPIDLARYQVINCYMGRVGLINSGGPSGDNDFAQAVRTAVINKRAGGIGLISGRKAFQRPMEEGIHLLNAIQNVYLCKEVTIA